MLDEFALACAKQPPILDNLGIKIDVAALPSYPLYSSASALRYGINWLDRFWCRYIRWWMAPEKHRIIDTIFSETCARHQVEFMGALLDHK